MRGLILTRLKAADDDAETLHPSDEEGSVDTQFYEQPEGFAECYKAWADSTSGLILGLGGLIPHLPHHARAGIVDLIACVQC
jgi:hypothetical protein